MSKIEEKITALNNRYEVARQQMIKESHEAFSQAAAELFKKHPLMESFGWTQYTPYFNDGEECTFSVHSGDPDINGINGYDIEDSIENKTEAQALMAAQKDVENLLELMNESTMEDIFGDHTSVTVHRDGHIETDDYSHD